MMRTLEQEAMIERLTAERDEWKERHLSEGSNRYWEGRWRDAAAENDGLRALLKECADDLEIEIGHRYPLSSGDVPGRDVYPDMQRRFERDMAPVFAARRALDQQLRVNSEEGK